MTSFIFHLAFPVHDIKAARRFYVDGLGCQLGRCGQSAMILNFHNHQLVAHLVKSPPSPQKGIYPRHYGLICSEQSQWENLLERCFAHELSFYEKPKLRHAGKISEHHTFFLADPSSNLLEFKYYRHHEAIFAPGGDLIGD